MSRGPSYRLPAEIIRDIALASSGLLNEQIGGPSVKPYQPEGLWKEKNEFSGFLQVYQPDSGDKLYRKSMYTFIRRSSPPPAMLAFDATSRDVCVVKREQTNTPLQALVLLNDPQIIEASRVLAERMQKEGGNSFQEQIHYAFRRICGRPATAKELSLLKTHYHIALSKYQLDPASAEQLLRIGEYPIDTGLSGSKTAALTMVVNTILNFDEAYTKR